MIEYLRASATPTLVTERMNEVAARGWAISSVTLATRDANNRPDSFQIDATRDALLYVETPGGAVHRDDIFYRLSRLDPASRGSLLEYLAQLEQHRRITDAPPQAAPVTPSASPPPPPGRALRPAAAIARAAGGTEVPADNEETPATSVREREASVECRFCGGDGSVTLELDPDDGIGVAEVPCPACNGVGTVSLRIAEQLADLQGRYSERARETSRRMTKQAAKVEQIKKDNAAAAARAESARLKAEAEQLDAEANADAGGETPGDGS